MGNVVSKTTKTWPTSKLNVTWMTYFFFGSLTKQKRTTKQTISFLISSWYKKGRYKEDNPPPKKGFVNLVFFHVITLDHKTNFFFEELKYVKLRWSLFVTYTIIQSIASSEMYSLHLTHPSAHTHGAVGSWGIGVLLKGLTSVVDNYFQSRDSNPQPRVTSRTTISIRATIQSIRLNYIFFLCPL